jgi:hypothetical protein
MLLSGSLKTGMLLIRVRKGHCEVAVSLELVMLPIEVATSKVIRLIVDLVAYVELN